MEKGKICVSVCIDSLDQLQLPNTKDFDLLELRLDCLKDLTVDFDLLKSFELILTLRPKEQGGKLSLGKQERIDFWRKLENSNFRGFIDCEFDLFPEACSLKFNKIASFHSFSAVPRFDDLEKLYKELSKSADFVKIAIYAEEATDAIDLWKLFQKASEDGKKLIPIAMGEGGKWTRILSLAYGSYLTYAAMNEKKKTAPGQLTVSDLMEVYRVKELSKETDVYALIAGNTEYSMSPYMHNVAFRYHGLDAVFIPMQVKNLDQFMRRMVKKNRQIELNFKGFAVTNPHKEAIIKYLDKIDPVASEIGAVNTVKIEDDYLKGFNTDCGGFIEPLLNLYGDLKGARVAVFGAGGVAKACIYELKKNGADLVVFARNLEKASVLKQKFGVELRPISKESLKDFDILVNATPLGTKGELENESVVTAEQIKDLKLVYDLVYNPFQTKLMKEADKVEVPKISGLAMLISQAIEQQKIWTGLQAPMREMSEVVLRKLK